MACALTQGNTYTACKPGMGGIKEVWLTEFDNVTAYTVASGIVTAITMASGKLFRRYILEKEIGKADWPLTGAGNVSYEHKVDFSIRGLTTSIQNELKLIAQNSLIIIVKEADDTFRIFGITRSMDLVTAGGSTEQNAADIKKNTLSFVGKEPNFPWEVQSSITTALLSAAA
jgi:hypothetical protein